MSYHATRFVADSDTLEPIHKLVLFQIASFHNAATGQCNPSPSTLARKTRLPTSQVKRIIRDLLAAGIIGRSERGFTFPDFKKGDPIPATFWPSSKTIDAILEAYPNHHFDMKEAVDDFIKFANGKGDTPINPDAAFERNICALLERRKPGKVCIAIEKHGEKRRSVRAFLSGRV